MTLVFFISGVAIFIYSMQQLEESLANMGDRTLKILLSTFTRTPLHGLLFGALTTAILQSSSVVGLITLAFAGAGMLSLKQAIGIVLGANLGTTLTGWLVATIGFKLNLNDFYIISLGIGALGILMMKQYDQIQASAKVVFHFGLLLMSMLVMKDSVTFIVELFDIRVLQGYHHLVFFLAGILLAAIIQSSSAVMIITLAALHAEIILLPAAASIMIGANLGTTSTILLGSTTGRVIKKQIAAAHFWFNLIACIASITLLPQLLQVTDALLGIEDPLFKLVAIHTLVNVVGIVLFFPFINPVEKQLKQYFQEKKTSMLHIEHVPVTVPEACLNALEQDFSDLFVKTMLYQHACMQMSYSKGALPLEEYYRALKHHEADITHYILSLQELSLSSEQIDRSQQLLVVIRDMIFSAKSAKQVALDSNKLFRDKEDNVIRAFLPLQHTADSVFRQGKRFLQQDHTPVASDLADMLMEVEATHSQMDSAIYHLINQHLLRETSASTAFNINREFLLSMRSLINALNHFAMPSVQAKVIADITATTHP